MKLTPAGKAFVTLVILGVVAYVTWYRWLAHRERPDTASASAPAVTSIAGRVAKAPPRPRGRIIVGISEFGGAYPGLVANGGAHPAGDSRFSARGLDVEFKLIRDARERLGAFERGEIDMMLMTLDYMADLEPGYHDKGVELRAFLMTDWSRGNLGIVAGPRVRTIEDLRDVKVAAGRNTEAHFFLLMMLRDSNLTPADVDHVRSDVIFSTKPEFANQMFLRGDVAAIATAEPYLSQILRGGKGHLLVSTENATDLIAEILCARADFLQRREADVTNFTRAWLEGVAQVEHDPQGAARHFAEAARLDPAEAHGLLSKIKLATFADNREFFGLEHEDSHYVRLFDAAEKIWQHEGAIKRVVPPAETRWLRALEAVAPEHANEKVHEDFRFTKGGKKGGTALLTKSVTIYFGSGSSDLDTNAAKIIDDFAEELSEFASAYVRVEGHTDSVGARAKNLLLSQRRAQAVVDDLVARHGFDRDRFQVVGHGADKPRGSNDTQSGRDLNRRTDFTILH